MTFRKRLQMDNPDKVGEGFIAGCSACPWLYGYEEFEDRPCKTKTPGRNPAEQRCRDCWNREIPGTEPTNKIEREENTMPTKTKAELLEEIRNLKVQVENLSKYEQYEKGANDCYASMQAYINAGFTRQEAFELIKQFIENAGKSC